MKAEVLLALVAACLFFVLVEQPLLAGLALIAAVFCAVSWFLSKGWGTSKAVGKGFVKGIPEQVSGAEPSGPGLSIAEEGLGNAAGVAGQQLYARDSQQLRFKGVGSVRGACERLIELFGKAFK